MAKDIRVYRNKVWFSGETKDQLLYLCNEMGVEAEEVVRRAIKGYRLWLREQPKTERRKHPRSSSLMPA